MRIDSATHHELAGSIHRLIQQEQYAEAQELLPSFAQAVVQACNEMGQEQEFLRAKEFLQSAVSAVKARQAHNVMQLEDLRHQSAYTGTCGKQATFDVTG